MFKKIAFMLMALVSILSSTLYADLTDISFARIELENTFKEVFKSEKIYTMYGELIFLEKEKKYDEAVRIIDKIVHLAYNDLGRTGEHARQMVRDKFVSFLYVLQARYNCELGRLVFAINECDLALTYDKNNAYAYFIKAYAYELYGNNQEAIKCVEMSAQLGCKEAQTFIENRKKRINNIMLSVFEGFLSGVARAFGVYIRS
jgi:tetratricopeptide (TPR) repeat protein